MRKKSTRLLSAALAACMMLSVLPVGAFAAETGAETESGVSVQAKTEAYHLQGGETIDDTFIEENGNSYSMNGDYTKNITIDATKDVVISVEGDVNVTASGILWNVKRVHDLTIENNMHTVEYAGAQILLVGAGAQVDKVTISGGTYLKKHSYDTAFEFNAKCNAELKDITVESLRCAVFTNDQFEGNLVITDSKFTTDSLVALALYSGSTTLNNVEATTKSSNVIDNRNGSICNIYGGKYTTDSDFIPIVNANATMNIHGGTFEGSGTVIATTGTGTTTIDETASETVIRCNNKEVTYHKAGVRVEGTSTTVINGCTIENAEYGIWVRKDTPSVTLKKADFRNNTTDIYLGTGLTIAIEDTFTDTATVKCEDADIDRQVTTQTDSHYQKDLKLVSNNPECIIDYKKNDDETEYRYLSAHENGKYYVNPIHATMAVGATEMRPYTQFEPGTKVTLNAFPAEEGKVLTGWKVEKIASPKSDVVSNAGLIDYDPENPETATLTVPDYDVFVTAEYEDVIIDPGTDSDGSDNIKGALSAVVVGAAAGAIIYETGTGIYRVINMPGIPMPSNRIELAELIWEHAGKPEPQSTEFYGDISEDDTDWQKAARWAVEQDLMQDDEDDNEFHPYFPVSKLRVCLTWNAAKEKGLFDTNKTAE